MLLDSTIQYGKVQLVYTLHHLIFFPFLVELGLARETGANYGPLLGKLLEWLTSRTLFVFTKPLVISNSLRLGILFSLVTSNYFAYNYKLTVQQSPFLLLLSA